MADEETTETVQPIAPKEEKPYLLRILSWILSPRRILGTLLVYAGIGVVILFSFYSAVPFSDLIERYGAIMLGTLLVAVGLYLTWDEVDMRRAIREERFVDVDARSRTEAHPLPYIQLIDKIAALEESSKTNVQELIAKFRADQSRTLTDDQSGFVQYFDSIRRVLEQKAAVADEKASILLDKGSNYSRFGITFFIFSIVAWQLIAHIFGFHVQHIYGIVSCSILFVFIEFLSAWYLKQYRQFIDTSTYLIKVKSIFDRYMLVYWASREASELSQDKRKSVVQLIDLLRQDIKWPETYLTKNPELSFAKEALETMTLFVKNVKDEAKGSVAKTSKAERDGA